MRTRNQKADESPAPAPLTDDDVSRIAAAQANANAAPKEHAPMPSPASTPSPPDLRSHCGGYSMFTEGLSRRGRQVQNGRTISKTPV